MPELFLVDSFTDRPFSGNPAGVCLLTDSSDIDESVDAVWMQNVAAELNQAETAFLTTVSSSDSNNEQRFHIRWFTPTVEVDLCGHATLASAHILWQAGLVSSTAPCHFDSRSGPLIAKRIGDAIQLDFPSSPAKPVDPPANILKALGVPVSFVGLSDFDYMVQVESAAVVRGLNPNMDLLSKLDSRGVIVTSTDESGQYDFVSRFFGPAVGINEDPVTGSAHCTLGPYWMEKLGKRTLHAWQASPRGGGMQVTVNDDRVLLLGNAVTVMKGQLLLHDI